MYILVNKEQIKERASMYQPIPDGRLIVPMGDLKVLGALSGVDILSGRELKQLIAQQEATKPKPQDSEEEIDSSFGVTEEQIAEAEKQEAMAIAATKKRGGK